MTKLETYIIYRIALNNNIASHSDITLQCRNYAGPREIQRTVDKLISEGILIPMNKAYRLYKPSGYYFFRATIAGSNVQTCTEIDNLIRSLCRGRNPIQSRKFMFAKIGTILKMSKADIHKHIRSQKFQLRFTKAAMRVVKEDIGRIYEDNRSVEKI